MQAFRVWGFEQWEENGKLLCQDTPQRQDRDPVKQCRKLLSLHTLSLELDRPLFSLMALTRGPIY